jgi:DNA-binding LytR/AlgR family response regulator
MIKLAICDDENASIEALDSKISNILDEKRIRYSVTHFGSGKELLSDPLSFDAIFLDIEMPGMDGISVGEQIMKSGSSARIVMATAAAERFKEAFKINAFRFITKPFDETEIKEALNAIVSLKREENCLDLFYQRMPYRVPFKSIQYINAQNGYSEAYAGGRIFRRDCSLTDIEQLLDPQFFARISRFCIVNMQHIDSYQAGVVMIHGKKLVVSKRRKKEFEKAYIEFDINCR